MKTLNIYYQNKDYQTITMIFNTIETKKGTKLRTAIVTYAVRNGFQDVNVKTSRYTILNSGQKESRYIEPKKHDQFLVQFTIWK